MLICNLGGGRTNKIAEKVGNWPLKSDHTKAQLAKELGVTAPTLNNRLSGETELSWKEVYVLANVLDGKLPGFR